jgi:5-methylcytosine-specific restriction endonuclease McrA
MIREATDRQRKSTNEMRIALSNKCKVPGCDKHLTLWKGPGEKDYCDEHQRNFKQFGGLATAEKVYSQHRLDYCEECNFQPAKLPRVNKYKKSDPKLFNSMVRSSLSVDHIDGNHENNDPSNLQTLCHNCHNIKTIENGDHLTPSNQNLI